MLRKVAAENNLSETAFLVPVGDHYDLRWFSPQREVKLCGHATLAAAYVVVYFLQPALQAVRFETLHAVPLLVRNDG
jgi:PhzF family phenazine biosynthesis protein